MKDPKRSTGKNRELEGAFFPHRGKWPIFSVFFCGKITLNDVRGKFALTNRNFFFSPHFFVFRSSETLIVISQSSHQARVKEINLAASSLSRFFSRLLQSPPAHSSPALLSFLPFRASPKNDSWTIFFFSKIGGSKNERNFCASVVIFFGREGEKSFIVNQRN